MTCVSTCRDVSAVYHSNMNGLRDNLSTKLSFGEAGLTLYSQVKRLIN